MPETCFTVWANVFIRGRLAAGETILIHGGSSGIGTTAIQLSATLGARVVVTAGSADKCRRCEGLGASLAIDYRQMDFVAELMSFTDQRGADVILDMVGGAYIARNLACLALDGRLVQIGVQQGGKAEIDLARVMVMRQTLTESTLRPRSPDQKAEIAAQLEAKVWPLIESGQVRPIIDGVFDLDQVREAHRRLESSEHVGKIVLRIREGS